MRNILLALSIAIGFVGLLSLSLDIEGSITIGLLSLVVSGIGVYAYSLTKISTSADNLAEVENKMSSNLVLID